MKKLRIMLLQIMVLMLLSAIFINTYENRHTSIVETLSRYGSRGEEVKKIQQKLSELGLYKGSVDGIYGKNTENAVKEFQRQKGLAVDGIAGPKTLTALGITEGGGGGGGGDQSGKPSDYTDNERNLLAKVINGEARGEVFEGQVAVGAVIMNRVRHPSFPNTISGVIYQPGAFTAIVDGQIDADMYEGSYRAADSAMSGVDPSGGAIYYYNPAKSTNKWIFSRPVIKTIGKHVFAK